MNPPHYIKILGNASDKGVVGPVVHETIVQLNEITENEVEISYDVKVSAFEGLPLIGRMIMESKAKTMEKQFTDNLRAKLREKLDQAFQA